MIGRTPAGACALLAVALAVPPGGGCAFAVKHPPAAAGILGVTLGFGTCKLASDNLGACAAVSGSAGAFLALVAAAAMWLGDDGEAAPDDEEQVLPISEDGQPRMPRPVPVAAPDEESPPSASPTPTSPTPSSPTPTSPTPTNPTPTSPTPSSPTPTSPTPSAPR